MYTIHNHTHTHHTCARVLISKLPSTLPKLVIIFLTMLMKAGGEIKGGPETTPPSSPIVVVYSSSVYGIG